MVDCEFPFDYGATLSEDGKKVESGMLCNSTMFWMLTLSSMALALPIHRGRNLPYGKTLLCASAKVFGNN